AGGSRAEEATLRAAQRAETDRLLRSRLDLTVVLFLFFVGASVVIESMQAPTRGRPVMLVYALEALACLLAVVACRLPGFPLGPRAIAAGLASILAALLSAYNASVGGSVERLDRRKRRRSPPRSCAWARRSTRTSASPTCSSA